MDLGITIAALAALLSVAVFCGWRGAKPYDPMRGPRLVPWWPLMLTAAVGALLLLTHLVNLLGVVTGR